MKLSIISLAGVLIFSLHTANAQDIEDGYYFLNKEYKPSDEKKAIYLLRIYTLADSCRQYSYYHFLGPLIRIETYKGKGAKLRQGFFAWYNKSGVMDSSGYYDEGLRDRLWLCVNAKGVIIRSRDFDKGRLVKETDIALEQEQAKAKALKDSAGHLPKRDEKESEFPGGPHGWLSFMNRNQRYPDRAVNNEIQGEVRLYFIVDTTGKLINPFLLKSVEVSLDEQALSLIRKSPDWIPATQDGRKVKSYKTQPIWYKLEIDNKR